MKQKIISLLLTLSCALSIHAQTMKDGIDYCKGGYYDDAIAVLEKCMDSPDTDKGTAYYYLGLAELGKKDVQKAQAALSKSIENANGSSVEPLLASGALALLNSDSKGAEGYFKKAEKQDKESPSVLREIARVYVMVDPVSYTSQIEQYATKCMKKGTKGQWAYSLIKGDLAGDTGEGAGFYEMAMNSDDNDKIEATAKYIRIFEEINPQYVIAACEQYNMYDPANHSIIDFIYLKHLLKNENYSKAKGIIAKVLHYDPNNEDMKRLMEEIKSK